MVFYVINDEALLLLADTGRAKMSKILQPSVILIEDVERVFMKKSGRSAQRWDMRRMRKELPKIIRSIAVEDRVLVIGTTTIPWQCEQRVIYFPYFSHSLSVSLSLCLCLSVSVSLSLRLSVSVPMSFRPYLFLFREAETK